MFISPVIVSDGLFALVAFSSVFMSGLIVLPVLLLREGRRGGD